MEWNKEQQHAINCDTPEILISAAAGSGKTAVLVERIKQMIISGEASVDQLLVVTFTKAAASEMRKK